MIKDTFASATDTVTAPAQSCFPITPEDNADLEYVTKGLYVGGGGDIVLRTKSDDVDIAFRQVPSGTILPVRAVAIRATGTSASDIVGLA